MVVTSLRVLHTEDEIALQVVFLDAKGSELLWNLCEVHEKEEKS